MDFTVNFFDVFFLIASYLAPLLLTLAGLIAGLGWVIGRRESWTLADSFYYAFVTATTVGYGDFRPATTGSKYLAIVVALLGLVLTGIMVAIAVHALELTLKASARSGPLMQDLLELGGGLEQ